MYIYTPNYDDDGNISSTHTVSKSALYICDCGEGYNNVIDTYFQAHGDTELKFSGTHYHFGDSQTHIAIYNVCCILCGGVLDTYYDRYSCPGNGACIAP